jgi:antitoxin FitA
VATIQVRELPDLTYEVLRQRARRAGKSLQAYMREQLVALAERPTKDEAVEQIEALLRGGCPIPLTPESIVRDVRADRR